MDITLKEGKTSLVIEAKHRTFSTGNKGIGYYGRLPIEGKNYQVSINFVEVKPKSKKPMSNEDYEQRVQKLQEIEATA